jgi:hypothetical protein
MRHAARVCGSAGSTETRKPLLTAHQPPAHPRRSGSWKLGAAVACATAMSMRLAHHMRLRAGPSCAAMPCCASASARIVSRCQVAVAASSVPLCTAVVAAMTATPAITLQTEELASWCQLAPAETAARCRPRRPKTNSPLPGTPGKLRQLRHIQLASLLQLAGAAHCQADHWRGGKPIHTAQLRQRLHLWPGRAGRDAGPGSRG